MGNTAETRNFENIFFVHDNFLLFFVRPFNQTIKIICAHRTIASERSRFLSLARRRSRWPSSRFNVPWRNNQQDGWSFEDYTQGYMFHLNGYEDQQYHWEGDTTIRCVSLAWHYGMQISLVNHRSFVQWNTLSVFLSIFDSFFRLAVQPVHVEYVVIRLF
jgi:hypothetical protein